MKKHTNYNYTECEFVGVTPARTLQACRYSDLVFYPPENDAYQFDTIGLAAAWLVREGFSQSIGAARVGISTVLSGKAARYRGFEISCVDKYLHS